MVLCYVAKAGLELWAQMILLFSTSQVLGLWVHATVPSFIPLF